MGKTYTVEGFLSQGVVIRVAGRESSIDEPVIDGSESGSLCLAIEIGGREGDRAGIWLRSWNGDDAAGEEEGSDLEKEGEHFCGWEAQVESVYGCVRECLQLYECMGKE